MKGWLTLSLAIGICLSLACGVDDQVEDFDAPTEREVFRFYDFDETEIDWIVDQYQLLVRDFGLEVPDGKLIDVFHFGRASHCTYDDYCVSSEGNYLVACPFSGDVGYCQLTLARLYADLLALDADSTSEFFREGLAEVLVGGITVPGGRLPEADRSIMIESFLSNSEPVLMQQEIPWPGSVDRITAADFVGFLFRRYPPLTYLTLYRSPAPLDEWAGITGEAFEVALGAWRASPPAIGRSWAWSGVMCDTARSWPLGESLHDIKWRPRPYAPALPGDAPMMVRTLTLENDADVVIKAENQGPWGSLFFVLQSCDESATPIALEWNGVAPLLINPLRAEFSVPAGVYSLAIGRNGMLLGITNVDVDISTGPLSE